MNRHYYTSELAKLRTLSKEFAQAYPSIAPLLVEDSTDPDVERLLEGFAYLAANIQEKLDNEFPELIHALSSVFFPSYLRPVPSCVMVQFSPPSSVGQEMTVPTHAQLASKPIDGVTCYFRTVAAISVQPLLLNKMDFVVASNGQHALELDFSSLGVLLNRWQSDAIVLYLSGNFTQAQDLFFLLTRFCTRIGIKAADADEFFLGVDALKPKQFSNDAFIDTNMQVDIPSRKIFREYLTFPQQFVLLELTQLLQWKQRGQGKSFKITFYFSHIPSWFNTSHKPQVVINAVPTVNLFTQNAQPINFDKTHYEYRVAPDGASLGQTPIYSIEEVEGFVNPRETVEYSPFSQAFSNVLSLNSYQVHYRYDPIKEKVDWTISVVPLQQQLDLDIVDFKPAIRVSLQCCNGDLAEQVIPGMLTEKAGGVPSNMGCNNLHTPSHYYPLQLKDAMLWRLLSLVSYNLLAEADLALFKEILGIEADFLKGFDRRKLQNRLDGITHFTINQANRLYYGVVIVGYDVALSCSLKHFDSHGDLFLFCSVLELFFANQVPFNTYLKLAVTINDTGEVITWKARTIDRTLE